MASTQEQDKKDDTSSSLELKFYAFYVKDMVQSRSGLAARPAFFSNFVQDLRINEEPVLDSSPATTSTSPAQPHHL